MTPEGKVKLKVKAMLTEFKAYQHWPVLTGYGAPTLDCIGCYHGLYFAVETKAPGKHLSPRQELTKSEIEAAGGIVFVIGEYEGEGYPGGYSGLQDLKQWLTMNGDQ